MRGRRVLVREPLTSCAIRSPHKHSKVARISKTCSRYWDMRTSRQPRSTAASERVASAHRDGARREESRKKRVSTRIASTPHTFNLRRKLVDMDSQQPNANNVGGTEDDGEDVEEIE